MLVLKQAGEWRDGLGGAKLARALCRLRADFPDRIGQRGEHGGERARVHEHAERLHHGEHGEAEGDGGVRAAIWVRAAGFATHFRRKIFRRRGGRLGLKQLQQRGHGARIADMAERVGGENFY